MLKLCLAMCAEHCRGVFAAAMPDEKLLHLADGVRLRDTAHEIVRFADQTASAPQPLHSPWPLPMINNVTVIGPCEVRRYGARGVISTVSHTNTWQLGQSLSS